MGTRATPSRGGSRTGNSRVKMKRFIERLAFASEKAAHVARACRKETDLFKLLVQEKETDGAAGSFAQDFKTLGDVLIQEMVRNDLAKTYPDLADHIQIAYGEKICVKVCSSQEETSDLLKKVLDGNEAAANILAKVVHSEFSEEDSDVSKLLGSKFHELPDEGDDKDISDLGIWIDPIDGTNQYIRGKEEAPAEDLLARSGLGVVTILIGIFSRSTGEVKGGVVNQPFVSLKEGEEGSSGTWTGEIHWGFGSSASFTPSPAAEGDAHVPKAVISRREDEGIRAALEASGFEVVDANGAGYKMLLVILGRVDIYITSKTYKWDTCAGHAILSSQGGGMQDEETGEEVLYHKPRENVVEPWANVGLIVAYRDKALLDKLKPLDKFIEEKSSINLELERKATLEAAAAESDAIPDEEATEKAE